MKLPDRIIDYILRAKKQVTLDQLVAKSTATGFSELDVLTALEQVHKDKRVQVRNLASGVTYSPAVSKPRTTQTHLQWIKNNYPTPDSWNLDSKGNFIEPFPEIDMSWIVMSPDEIKEFKAEMSGKPMYIKKKYA